MVVLITKSLAGAWITILAMGIFFMFMRAIRKHYDRVAEEIAADDEDKVLPTRVHAIVLASKLHKPTLRALAYAKATRPNVLEAVYVSSDAAATDALLQAWDDRRIDVPLKVLHSPYRELIEPIVDYAVSIRRRTRAEWWPSTSPSTSWAAGGSSFRDQTALQAQGAPAVHARRDGHLGALPAAVLRGSRRERETWEQTRIRPGDVRRGQSPFAIPPAEHDGRPR